MGNIIKELRENPRGKCYEASEALYHLFGGKEAGLTPIQGVWEGVSHWALRTKEGKILDLTVGQFETVPNYSVFRGRGFLTKEPSKKAQKIIDEVNSPWDKRISTME